ncbi:hypothetical protein RDI58_017672 [Solanum bulbocastanum]|uniref:Uncharacterized protein n=1 Tax=Solanum bulbocastanum TaxID=147425 RepID=A0AAN8T960_SOLBU
MKLVIYCAMKAFQLVIILNSPPLSILNYESMMNMAVEIVTRCALVVNGKLRIDYQDVEIFLESPWRRETMSCSSVGHLLNEVFEMVVAPKLLQPIIVLDYPIEISPLAKPYRRLEAPLDTRIISSFLDNRCVVLGAFGESSCRLGSNLDPLSSLSVRSSIT